eukprot:scaffold4887_cov118-Cylindrotheca_fusiformis.AAC.7
MDVRYHSIEKAAESWRFVQKIPNYRTVVGELLFRHIFELAPSAISLYGFGIDIDDAEVEIGVREDVYKSPVFLRHARGVVSMLETAINMMLEGDLTGLADTLRGLGARHVGYGVLPAHYTVVEAALLKTLQTALKKKHWSNRSEKHWSAVFKFIAMAMMMGAHQKLEMKQEQRRESAGGTMLVISVLSSSLRKLEDIYDQYAQ